MDSDNIPRDPAILQSYVNTQLRDHYASLAEMCDDIDIPLDEMTRILAAAGLEYEPALNKVW